MAGKTLPLDPVVNILVNLAAKSAVRKAFNLALLIGETTIIPQSERIRTYTGISEMLEDGFKTTDRLYKAAALIFGQAKTPPKVAIGCIGTVTEDETTRVETPVETIAACREANGEWYVGIYCADITKAEHLTVAEYIEAITPNSLYTYTTSDADVLTNDDGNIFAAMKAKNYRRSLGQYSSKHDDAVCAIIGWAMGAMTGTAGSAYTIAYKTEVGVETENSSSVFASSTVDKIKGNNGNVYINRGSSYDIFEEGTMADGTWFDEMIFLDKYQNDMQLSLMDLLYQSNKIAQTEAGMTQLKDAIKEVCETMNKVGFIKSGVWNSTAVLSLAKGDTLPNGYLIQSEAIDEQAQADRDARKAPNIYVSLKLAGAIHHVTVQVDVNR
ncbi:DUF3383 family protein [Sporomusa aerivorans]|uniref:DUF3383 family protein n=1 Tax=Sporomusa aerivorans TaxID=204936 RepID=UPI00352A5473